MKITWMIQQFGKVQQYKEVIRNNNKGYEYEHRNALASSPSSAVDTGKSLKHFRN